MQFCIEIAGLIDAFQASQDFVCLQRYHSTHSNVRKPEFLQLPDRVCVGLWTPTLRNAQRHEPASTLLVFFEKFSSQLKRDFLTALPILRSRLNIEFWIEAQNYVINGYSVIESEFVVEIDNLGD